MTTAPIVEPSPARPQRPLRLWPGVVAAALAWIAMLGVPAVAPAAAFYGIIGGLVGGLLVILWWLFFSRAPWPERVGGLLLMVAALFVTSRLVHPSVAGAGMGMLIYIFGIPVLSLGLVAGVVASRHLASGPRRASIAAAIVLACLALMLVRLDGINGHGGMDLEWRWKPTAEERLLAHIAEEPALVPDAAPVAEDAPPVGDTDLATAQTDAQAAPGGAQSSATDANAAAAHGATESTGTGSPEHVAATAGADETELSRAGGAADSSAVVATNTDGEWPGFRGPERDGIVHGVRIESDWAKTPPVELWRRAVGPGWSSFAIDGDRFYTQEQLGEEELVSSYNLKTGEPVWRHRDPARFWEANAGAGPRGTPTLHGGRVYSFGATGILNALDTRDGSVVWSRNVASETETKVPYWGFASSPIVVGDLVIVAATGTLAAYDLATGEPRWHGPAGKCCYSSPQLATIDGVPQILLLNGAGVISVAAGDGTMLWEHAWPGDGIVQPGMTEDGDVLIGTGSGMGGETGIRRIAVERAPGDYTVERGSAGWTVEERWTSTGLKPYFNDFVVHEGHAYGFDGGILACIDLKDGQRKWKGGRYGDGQLILLADQDLLLVLSEKGGLVLVDAKPDQFTERAQFPAIEGKTWNHPALAGDVVLVRNSEEMAAFRLSPAVR